MHATFSFCADGGGVKQQARKERKIMCRCFKLIMLGVMAISADISFGYETIVLGDYTYTYEVQRYTSSTNTIVRGISPLKGDMVMPDVIAGYKVTSVDVSFKKTNV